MYLMMVCMSSPRVGRSRPLIASPQKPKRRVRSQSKLLPNGDTPAKNDKKFQDTKVNYLPLHAGAPAREEHNKLNSILSPLKNI
jgi:hypothetical protein